MDSIKIKKDMLVHQLMENQRLYTYRLNGKNKTVSKSKQSSKFRGVF